MLRRSTERIKSDERILGDGDFVEAILKRAQEHLEARYDAKARGMDLQAVAGRVGQVLDVDPDKVWEKGKRPDLVKARSLFCYWAVRELGVTSRALAKELGLTQPAISIAARRGENIAEELKVNLFQE